MNILIKLMSIVSLVVAPTLAHLHSNTTGTQPETPRVERTFERKANGETSAIIFFEENKNSYAILPAVGKDHLA